ncbi:hypothetical protein Q5752_004052 [Cryptotrichosporon argae]
MLGSQQAQEYTLRVAFLHNLREQRRHTLEAEKARAAAQPARRANDGGSRFFSLDLGALANKDRDKSSKYPERLLRYLDGSLQRIALRNDPKYNDHRFCQAIDAFRSAYIVDKAAQRQLRESRSLEELILAFAATSTKTLKKDVTLVEGAWKDHLDSHIALFLDVLSDNLASISSTATDLRERLELYQTKLKNTAPPPPSADSDTAHAPHFSKVDTAYDAVEVTAKLFDLEDEELQRRISAIRPFCTLQAAVADYKLRQQAYEHYIREASERFAIEGGKSRAFALGLAGWIESSTKKLKKRFPDPIAPEVDVVSIALHQHLSLWLRDLEDAMAQTISLSINDYCNEIESLFAGDMQQTESVQTSAKQKAWVEKAKKTIAHLQGERRLQAFFNFTPNSCVKLNNIDSARNQLDKLYQELRVDELASYQPVDEVVPTQKTFLFTVKIVLAEGLVHEGSSKAPDAFIVLSDEHGNRYAKTRTVYAEFDPRWDETFDVPVRGPAWFMITARHRSLAGKHDVLGRALLLLDPQEHTNLVSKDVLLPLDSAGQVLVRLSVEGERDDIQFHFGRAFRWLKRTEADMVRVFVDKMTPVLRHTLSRASIKSVLKPGGAIDYQDAWRISNDAIGRLSAAYRTALGSTQVDHAIPLPSGEHKPRRGPSDAEIEVAIHPLFDYLDTNNHTLASHLSPEAMKMVMTKLWKQILMTIEGLIVPPLSDKPSSMRALSDGELDIALRWLKFLRDFLYAGGDPSGVPLDVLQNHKFNEIMSIRIYYDWTTDDLMEASHDTRSS